ncbi:MAG: lysine 5,6-aminomutase reactivase subunit KamB [Bacilli bacterium]
MTHAGHSPLWERVDALGVRDLAIVGVSKHAGKTTALVRLIEDASRSGRRLGVASVGVDGERVDSVLGTPKPPIPASAGDLFATAVGAMKEASAPVEWIEPTGISSPFGEVWIGRAMAAGTICLAGVRQLAHLLLLRERFRALGADHVIYDGALSRMIAMHPDAVEGVVLATGAVVGNMEDVVRATRQGLRKVSIELAEGAVARFCASQAGFAGVAVAAAEFPAVPASARPAAARFGSASPGAAEPNMAEPAVARPNAPRAAGENGNRTSEWSRALLSDIRRYPGANAFTDDIRAAADLTERHRVFYYSGAVTDAVAQSILLRPCPSLLVAESPAHVFLSEGVWRQYTRRGHAVAVRRSALLVGVVVNPVSPSGAALPRAMLRQRIEALTDVPVWDVME